MLDEIIAWCEGSGRVETGDLVRIVTNNLKTKFEKV